MKKYYKISLGYLLLGLFIGFFYHEAAYWTNFSGVSVLSKVHPHILTLGAGIFFIIPILIKLFEIDKLKSFKLFMIFYNLGLIVSFGFMITRGIYQLFNLPLSKFLDHMIGGLAGIGHVILTIGICFLFYTIIKSCDKKEAN